MTSSAAEEPLHPIVDFATSLMVPGDGEACALDASGEARLKEQLSLLYGDPSLRKAVVDLVRLACWLDTEARCPRTSAALVKLLGENAVEPLRALKEASAGGEIDAKPSEFERFRGDSVRSAKAPQVGEAAPDGSVKAGSLNYPKKG